MTNTDTLKDIEEAYDNLKVLNAQQKLVNLAIRTALEQMAATRTEIKTDLDKESNTEAVFSSFRSEILTKAKTYSQLLAAGNNIDKIMDALTTIDNEFDRVRAYNLLAKHNEFDLSLKSSGHKELPRLKEKIETRIATNDPTPAKTDITRMTAVSSTPEILDNFAELLQSALAETHRCDKGELEEWSMRDKALLSKVLKASVDGLGAEVQFLPRHQARVAARLTHYYYKIIRSFETLEKQFELTGDSYNFELGKEQIRKEFNKLADFINDLKESGTLGKRHLRRANKLFKDPAMSDKTFDDVSEGAGKEDPEEGNFFEVAGNSLASLFGQDASAKTQPKSGPALPYSKMFKTVEDVKKFKEYFAANGERARLFPLERMTRDDIRDIQKMAVKMQKLIACTQLTNTCYMVDAPDAMRELWLQKAVDINAIKTLRQLPGIPLVLLETVAKGNEKNTALQIPEPQEKVREAGHGRA